MRRGTNQELMPIFVSNHEKQSLQAHERASKMGDIASDVISRLAASSDRKKHGWVLRSIMVVLAVAAAFFIRDLLARGHPEFAPFITYYPVVLLAALIDGMWAGVLGTILSACVAEIWSIAPKGQWFVDDFSDLTAVALFTLFGISLSIVIELFHRNRERLAQYELNAAVDAERRKTEKEHEISELIGAERKRLIDVLETLPSMVSLMSKDHRVKFANSAFRQRFGDCAGVRCYEARFGRSEPCDRCEAFWPLTTGEPHRWEVCLANGSLLDTHNFPFTDLDGSSVILEVSVDITEQRKAESELRSHRERLEELVRERTRQLEVANTQLESDIDKLERAQMNLAASEAKLKAALSSLPDSVIILDTAGNFLDFNAAFAALSQSLQKPGTARSVKEFDAQFDAFLPGGERANWKQLAFNRALNGERGDNVEYTLRRKDTGQTWIRSLSFGPITDRNGAITGAVVTGRDITAAKRAEARLRRFYETELIAILYWKIDGRVIDANDRYLAMTGYTRADLLAGRINWSEMTPPEYRDRDEEARRQVRETGVHFPYEKEYIRKDGRRVWGLFWAAAYEDDRTEGVSFILDIAERKRAEAELAQAKLQAERSAAQLRTIFDGMEERVYVCDAAGNVIVANDVARRSYETQGHSQAPAVHEMPRYIEVYTLDGRLLSPDEWPIKRAMRGEHFNAMEICVHFKHTNDVRILSSSGAPVRDKDGKIVMAVLTSVDITSRKRAEEELRRKEARLRMSLDAARSGTWELDRERNVAEWSDELWALFGLEPGKVEPSFETWLSVVHPEDRKRMGEMFTAACEAGAEVDITYRILRRDGEVRWLAARGNPILDNELRARSYIGIVTDITERKAAEAALRESEKISVEREQLQALAERLSKAREEERTRVSRDLHDQIGQILTAIKMDLMWMSKRAPVIEVQKRLKDSIELINEGVQSVRTICSGLRPRILDDLGLCAAIEWEAHEFTTRTGIECFVSIASNDSHLDPDQTTTFFRIFQECLTNVSRHAGATHVDVCFFENENHLVMEVEDNGKGFCESEVSGSLGILGMKERAHACGGDLQVQSSPGAGTSVSVRIPAKIHNGLGTAYAHPDC
jgi:two-component system sensor histidine kinase UhpB